MSSTGSGGSHWSDVNGFREHLRHVSGDVVDAETETMRYLEGPPSVISCDPDSVVSYPALRWRCDSLGTPRPAGRVDSTAPSRSGRIPGGSSLIFEEIHGFFSMFLALTPCVK